MKLSSSFTTSFFFSSVVIVLTSSFISCSAGTSFLLSTSFSTSLAAGFFFASFESLSFCFSSFVFLLGLVFWLIFSRSIFPTTFKSPVSSVGCSFLSVSGLGLASVFTSSFGSSFGSSLIFYFEVLSSE